MQSDRETLATPRFSGELERVLRGHAAAMRSTPAGTWRRRLVAAVATAAVAATALVIFLPGDEQGVARANALLLPNGRVIPFSVFTDAKGAARFERLAADYGVEVRVNVRAVGSVAENKVIDVSYPAGADVDEKGRLHVSNAGLAEPIVITVGRHATPADRRRAGHAGIPYETPAKFCQAIDPQDPQGTSERLRREGYEVRWTLIAFHLRHGRPIPGRPAKTTRSVEEPPPGTIILSVGDADHGRLRADTRALAIELVDPDDFEVSSGGEPPGQGLFCTTP